MNNYMFQSGLLPGERIVWTGQPDLSILFNKSDLFLVPFTFLWFFGIASTIPSMFGNLDEIDFLNPFALIPFFFIFIGFYMSFGRFIYKTLQKKKTYYAVTNKRVLILTNFLGKQFHAISIDKIPTINKSIRRNGTGSLIFGTQNMASAAYSNTGMELFGNSATIQAFFDIKNAEEVYRHIVSQQKV